MEPGGGRVGAKVGWGWGGQRSALGHSVVSAFGNGA